MSTPISQMPKPGSEQYKGKRKLFLVPTYMLSPDLPDDGKQVLERYWTEVRDHVHNLERSLGSIVHVFHEAVSEGGENGLRTIEGVNPQGYSFVQALCQSTARLEATDDMELLQESMDWQRCLSMGLISAKVTNTAVDGFRVATDGRFEHIASKIDEALKEEEVGALFIREEHKVQFPDDVQVFYVAPPALDALKRWIDGQARAFTERMEESAEKSAESQDTGAEGSGGPAEEEQPSES